MTDKTPKVPDFIKKLYQILQNSENQDIISWKEAEFVIKNTEALVTQILPKYYRHSKLKSFVRQLNLYGFRKLPKRGQREYLYFKNEIFRQNSPQLLHKIQLKSKGKKCDASTRQDDIREVTKQRLEHLDVVRSAFKYTIETIYQQIREISNSGEQSDNLINESMFLLQLCGVKGEGTGQQESAFSQQSVTHFLTKFNLD